MGDQFEYRLNLGNPTQRMPVPFTPDVVFIYNPSNAALFLNTSTYNIPTITLYDLYVAPHSYVVFVPYTPNTEYGGLLVVPGGGAIEWDCWIEFRRGEKELDWDIAPGQSVIFPLNPLPDTEVLAGFEVFAIEPRTAAWCKEYDLSNNGGAGWGSQGDPTFGTYVAGVGFRKVSDTTGGTSLAIVSSGGVLYPAGCKPEGMQIGYSIADCPSTANRDIQISQVNPTETYSETGLVNGSYLDTITFSGLEHRRITASISPLTIVDDVTTLIIDFIRLWGSGVAPLSGDDCADPIPGATVSFLNTSVGDIASVWWDFGDGETSTDYDPVHTYIEDGVYTVTLCVFGIWGGVSCNSGDVYVNTVSDSVLEYV